MREDISVVLVGMGGYGAVYLKELLNPGKSDSLRFVAAVDPEPDKSELIGEVHKRGIPVYRSFKEFQNKARADLVVLASPPQFHCEQVVAALEQGSHVLCEKPAAASPAQVREMIAARDRAGKLVAIGYQWSFSPAIHRLKTDIAGGRFGAPRRLKTSVYWPRGEQYYSRNGWAGRQRDGQGRLVLDSPVNNACAHFLHNMFYVLGDRLDRSAVPALVVAELYRAHDIKNYDTAAIRCNTTEDVEVLFIASHSVEIQQGPILRYAFENAVVSYDGEPGGTISARISDGSLISYGEPVEADSAEKLLDVCKAIRTGEAVACGLEAAGSQTSCMYAAQESMPDIIDFPREMICVEGEIGARRTYVRGLSTALDRCFEEFRLPSELGFDWSRPGKKITIGQESSDAVVGV